MSFSALFLCVWILCKHGLIDPATSATETKSSDSTEYLATSTRSSILEHRTHWEFYKYLGFTSLCRSSLFDQAPPHIEPTHSCNGRIMEMPEMLENTEWKACTLLSMWRALGQGGRFYLCPTRSKPITPRSRTKSQRPLESAQSTTRRSSSPGARSFQKCLSICEEAAPSWTEKSQGEQPGCSELCEA